MIKNYWTLIVTGILLVTMFFTLLEKSFLFSSTSIFELVTLRVLVIFFGFLSITFIVLYKNVKEGAKRKKELKSKSDKTFKELKKMAKK